MKNANEESRIQMTPGEEAFIARFTADYCRPHEAVMAERLAAYVAARQLSFLSGGSAAGFALAAGVSAPESVPEVRAPDEEVRFSFASDGAPDAPGAWRATLVVPPRAVPETLLALTVENAAGAREADGVFTLSGTALPLVAGRAEIPFGVFLAGIKNTSVSFRRPGGPAVPGTLAFFC